MTNPEFDVPDGDGPSSTTMHASGHVSQGTAEAVPQAASVAVEAIPEGEQ